MAGERALICTHRQLDLSRLRSLAPIRPSPPILVRRARRARGQRAGAKHTAARGALAAARNSAAGDAAAMARDGVGGRDEMCRTVQPASSQA